MWHWQSLLSAIQVRAWFSTVWLVVHLIVLTMRHSTEQSHWVKLKYYFTSYCDAMNAMPRTLNPWDLISVLHAKIGFLGKHLKALETTLSQTLYNMCLLDGPLNFLMLYQTQVHKMSCPMRKWIQTSWHNNVYNRFHITNSKLCPGTHRDSAVMS